jgi:toxin ParE1/3/4
MSRYVLSRRARRDLQDIWQYTARRWTVARADGYLADIIDTLVELAAGRQHSLPAEEFRRGYRRSLVGSHVVFYRVGSPDEVFVLRILHQSMDAGRHLRSPRS